MAGNIPFSWPLAALGTLGGAAFGRYVSPEIAGYGDVPEARRMSTTMHGLLAGGAAGLSPAVSAALSTLGPRGKAILGLLAATAGPIGWAAAETLPQNVATQKRISDAQQAVAKSTVTSSVPHNIKQLFSSPITQGAGLGAVAAGGLGMLSGLTRRKSEQEQEKGRTRGGMMTSDALRYLLPAMIAGGVIGSLRTSNTTV